MDKIKLNGKKYQLIMVDAPTYSMFQDKPSKGLGAELVSPVLMNGKRAYRYPSIKIGDKYYGLKRIPKKTKVPCFGGWA